MYILINYVLLLLLFIRMYSFDESCKKPMHREVGFIRIKPGTNKVAYLSAHNNGL